MNEAMLGFTSFPILHVPSKFNTPTAILPPQIPNFPSPSTPKSQLVNLNSRNRFRICAENGDNGNKKKEDGNGVPTEKSSNGEEGKVKNRFNLRWADLLLDPNPDNIVAVGLTGLLTWASVQVLWQLFVISAAILIAALKYTLVAALLISILISLL